MWNEPPLFVVVRNVLIVCMFIHARRKTFSMGMHRSETFCHAFVMQTWMRSPSIQLCGSAEIRRRLNARDQILLGLVWQSVGCAPDEAGRPIR